MPNGRGMRAPICASCHRGFAGAKQNQLVQCARCHAPTCAICSRNCNGCPPSAPPTPALTSAPSLPETPLASPFPVSIPRRPALVPNTNTALGATPPPPIVGRRRKARDREDEDGCKDMEYEMGEKVDDLVSGCGRTICRNCSFETPESDMTTCYDCAGSSPVQA
ncbi:hypothetical protein C8Q76DRAFT_609255 [Earliella scabrosa]|nr:hypothetical protein C8Q76DRAFT_609255 [Earliella scabrosa]